MKYLLQFLFTVCWGVGLGFLLGYLCFDAGQNKLKTKTEYTLEILNQDSVQIYSPSTNNTYKCEMERIEEILIVDNL